MRKVTITDAQAARLTDALGSPGHQVAQFNRVVTRALETKGLAARDQSETRLTAAGEYVAGVLKAHPGRRTFDVPEADISLESRRVAFEQHDDAGRAFRLVYTVPGDAPADLTEAQAEALDPNAPVRLDGTGEGAERPGEERTA